MKASSRKKERERERERERDPQLPKVVEAHETREMLSNAKEKTFKCSSALEAGLTVVSTLAISTHVCRIIN
jgi:hypothetical protein